jgi:hypothetical protein
MLATSSRAASIVLVPVTSFAGYATYVRSNTKPTSAHSELMRNDSLNKKDQMKWRKINNGLGLVDVGRSGGGL